MLAQPPNCANPTGRPAVAHVRCDCSSRPALTVFVGLDVRPFTPACYNFNNSRNLFVCARDTGISDCRLSFIFSM